MKHELDKMMDLIKDYKTGYGGVTDSFMRKELEMFAKDYHSEQCNIADVNISLERAKKYARHQHFLGTQGSELVEFEDWAQD